VVPSDKEIAYVPGENLHVSRAEFGAVWTAAEELAEEGARNETGTWYTTAVVVTCRWVGLAIVRPRDGGRGYPAFAPVSETSRMAYPELIERESLAAEVQLWRRPVSKFLQGRPGWAEGVDATFAWLWRKTGPPPVSVERTRSGPATT
jgi:hypothetical protein